MAFPDPVVLILSGQNKSLALTGRGPNSAEYHLLEGTSSLHLITRQNPETKGGRRRAIANLQREAVVANSLEAGTSYPASYSVQLSVDFPGIGVVPADIEALVGAMIVWLQTTGVVGKLLNGET